MHSVNFYATNLSSHITPPFDLAHVVLSHLLRVFISILDWAGNILRQELALIFCIQNILLQCVRSKLVYAASDKLLYYRTKKLVFEWFI